MRPLAGGTRLLASPVEIPNVLDLSALDLLSLRVEDEDLVLGAMTTLQDVIDSPLSYQATAGLLPAACRAQSPSRMIRGAATLGGESVHGDPDSEVVAALLALNAVYVVAHPEETRESPALRFLKSPVEDLAGGGLVRSIVIPGAPARRVPRARGRPAQRASAPGRGRDRDLRRRELHPRAHRPHRARNPSRPRPGGGDAGGAHHGRRQGAAPLRGAGGPARAVPIGRPGHRGLSPPGVASRRPARATPRGGESAPPASDRGPPPSPDALAPRFQRPPLLHLGPRGDVGQRPAAAGGDRGPNHASPISSAARAGRVRRRAATPAAAARAPSCWMAARWLRACSSRFASRGGACRPWKGWARRRPCIPCRPRSSSTRPGPVATARPACCSVPRRSSTPSPIRRRLEARDALGGCLCPCAGHAKPVAAVLAAARARP